MVNKLKSIFKNSSPKLVKIENEKYSNYQEFSNENWKDDGWNSARNQNGSETALKVCIARMYHNHKETLRRDEVEQENAKRPFKVKLQGYISKNESFQKKVEKLRNEDIPLTKDKNDQLNSKIRNIRNNPEELVGEKSEKAGFLIGTVILFFLSLYLFVFYSSASYSAFFKEFTLNDLGVADSIFDPQAISKAFAAGITELILILTIPFVFIGLGYLIHKFQESKGFGKYLKVSSLVIVTFIFDSILAYEITHKIYNLKAENSYQDIEPYSVALAFQSVNFWLIIFAGFVVYIVWGFVFDFVMETYYKMDKIVIAIKQINEEIKENDKKISDWKDEINKLNYLMGENATEANKLRTILDHSDIIKPMELEKSIHEFLDGWLEWLTSDRRAEKIKQIAHDLVDEFLAINVKPLEFSNNLETTNNE